VFYRLRGICRTSTTSSVISGVGILLVLLAGACSDDEPDAKLPSTTAPGAPTTSPSPTSVEDAVTQSYSQYWTVLPQAEQAKDPGQRQRLLADFLTNPLLTDVLKNIDAMHSKGLTSSGHIVVHAQKVQVKGDQATLWDCQDSTQALLKNARTEQVTSRGTPNDHVRATLGRGSDGRWRINHFTPLGRC